MDIIKSSITKPVTVSVCVLLLVLFGMIGLFKLPIQLTPDVTSPQISVSTTWPGATPYEIEKDIIEKQEEVLKSLRGLTTLESSSFNNYAEILLTFKVGTKLDEALLRVSNKMEEVTEYPENANKPIINSSGGQDSPVIWAMLKTLPENKNSIYIYKTFFENEVRQYIERVSGVGSLFIFGGTEKQLDITIDTEKLAQYSMTIGEVINRISTSNQNISAGILGMSKKNYRIRTISQYESPSDPLDVVLRDDGLHRVLLKDVATAGFGYATNDVSVMQNRDDVIVIGIRKEQGANVISLTKDSKEVVEILNTGILKDNGLYIEWVYDQVPYINTAIATVRNNVLIGGLLAMIVLFLFLRCLNSTITVAIAIPISFIGTFIFMWILGRNINVVSLAGISFAIGMLVDNSIVVLENIDRHRNMGKSAFKASYDGTKEVWGAVLASTMTTIAVFLPIIFIQEEAGQLFKDIAIAITFSILISLFVSISVIPTITNKLFGMGKQDKHLDKNNSDIGKHTLVKNIIRLSNLSLKNVTTRIVTIASLTGITLLIMFILMPNAEYLPQGNRNLIITILIPPPGYSENKMTEIGKYIFDQADPYIKEDNKDGIPQIQNMFYVGADRMTIMGGISKHETRARELIPLFNRIVNSIPDIFGISIQMGIFQDRLGHGRTIDLNISGEKIDRLIEVARMFFGILPTKIKNAQIRPIPSLEMSYPETNIIPDRSKLVANGMTETEFGTYIDILMDGRVIGEYKPEGKKKIDLVLKCSQGEIESPEDIYNSIIINNYGNLIRVKDVSTLKYSQGMTQIDHLERSRNIRLEITPPDNIPLETAMNIITKDVSDLAQAGKLEGVKVSIGGNADKLTETMLTLRWNFLLALVITYLLMAALFENFLYPLIIMFTIPLAGAGGFIGLLLVDTFIAPQSFDILTMLGFIILIGTVVNNAILIVHQSLNNVRYESMQGDQAIKEAVRTRIRPIFMGATTTVFGLLPLAISTGAGSELYRGLGSVLLGGLALSTILTLFVIPASLSFFIGREKKKEINFS